MSEPVGVNSTQSERLDGVCLAASSQLDYDRAAACSLPGSEAYSEQPVLRAEM